MKKAYISLFVLATAIACTSVKPPKPADSSASSAVTSVVEPLNGFEIAPRYFEVSATAAGKIDLPNGGTISFPEKAFVDGSGNPVTGTVKVEWKEYHSLTDIMVSGIPMEYDSSGVSGNFVSGGMFSIDASQNGKEIEIAKGKEATISLATYDPKPGYNFYSLDESTGKWSYELTKNAEPNPKAAQESAVKEEAKPASKEIFLDMAVQFDRDSFPELDAEEIIGWNVAGNALSGKEKSALANGRWTGKLIGKSGKEYKLAIAGKAGKYEISGKPVTMNEALANTKNVEKATGNRWETLLNFQKQAKMAALIRTASIPGFGTYNWDYVHSRQDPIAFKMRLKMPENRSLENAEIFHVCPAERSVIHYKPADFGDFNFEPNLGNCIVIVYPDQTVYTVNDDRFDAARKSRGKMEFTFDSDKSPQRFRSPDDLGKIVSRSI